MSNRAMLDVRGLTKKYRNRAVVDHVTFTVPPGQVTCAEALEGRRAAAASAAMRGR